MKRKTKSVWIIAALAMLTLGFTACGGEKTTENDTADPKVTTTTSVSVVTEESATTTEKASATTKTVTTTTVSATKESVTTAATTAKPADAAQEKTPTVQPTSHQEETVDHTPKPTVKTTTAKPTPKPTVKTTAAPKGHYETIHHDAVTQQVWVEDAPAATKTIYECYCGKQFDSSEERTNHAKQYIGSSDEEWELHSGYHFWYENVPAQGHYETKVIQEAYDEQIWVWD